MSSTGVRELEDFRGAVWTALAWNIALWPAALQGGRLIHLTERGPAAVMHLLVLPAIHQEEHDDQVRVRLHLWQQANRAGAGGICGRLLFVGISLHGFCCLQQGALVTGFE